MTEPEVTASVAKRPYQTRRFRLARRYVRTWQWVENRVFRIDKVVGFLVDARLAQQSDEIDARFAAMQAETRPDV